MLWFPVRVGELPVRFQGEEMLLVPRREPAGAWRAGVRVLLDTCRQHGQVRGRLRRAEPTLMGGERQGHAGRTVQSEGTMRSWVVWPLTREPSQ